MKLSQGKTSSCALIIAQLWTGRTLAQSATSSAACPTLNPPYPAPVVAPGWQAQLVATGLSAPRSILFDASGHLLVVQAGHGVVNLELADQGGICVGVLKKTYLINSTDVKTPSSLETSLLSRAALAHDVSIAWDSVPRLTQETSSIMALPCPMMARRSMPLPPRAFSRGRTMPPPRLSAAKTRPWSLE